MAKQKDSYDKYPVKAGFYDEEMRTTTAVPWMQGTECSPGAVAMDRAFANKEFMDQWNTLENRLSRQEMFQGQYTFRANDCVPPKKD